MAPRKAVKSGKPTSYPRTHKTRPGTASKIAGNHRCSICRESFSVNKSLTRHMKTVHAEAQAIEKIVDHQCLTCSRSFSRKDVLARHQKYQHDRENENCSFCGRSFAIRALKDHLRSKACRAMQDVQACEDAKEIQRIKISAARFRTSVVLDPLAVAYECYACSCYAVQGRGVCHSCFGPYKQPFALREARCPTYWELRGLTMRSINEALANPTHAGSSALAGAILIASMLDFKLGFHESTSLYRRILRIAWTKERYQKDQETIRSILLSAFTTLDDMHRGSTCCQKISLGPGVADVVMIVDVFGVILMSEATSKHMTERGTLLFHPNIGLDRSYVTRCRKLDQIEEEDHAR